MTTDDFSLEREESIFSWAMFDLRRRNVRSPGEVTFERTYVASPGAVAVVATTESNEVILVRQYRASLNARILEIPAGMRDIPGEDPRETALRELTEETGFIGGNLEYLAGMWSSPGVTDSLVEIYTADVVEAGTVEPHGPEEEHMEVLRVPFDDALRMVDAGEILDSKTVFGLLAADRRRRIGGA